jgi:hypothetical protein
LQWSVPRELLWAVIFALAIGVGSLLHALNQHPPYAPQIQAKQQPDGAFKGEHDTRRGRQEAAKLDEQQSEKHPERGENEGTEFWPSFFGLRLKITDSMLAAFTFGLLVFTGLLWRSTDKLWAAGEKQFGLLSETAVAQSRDMQISIKAADESNALSREIFITEQRPWLLWKIPPIIELKINGRNLEVGIVGSLTNLGKAPAFDIAYFGKLYTPPMGVAAINYGISYFAEHLEESRENFSLASALPTETVPMRFGPYGIDVATLPQDARFTLFLSFHAKYEYAIAERRLAQIGTVYMVQPIGKDRLDFSLADISQPIPVALVEWSGSRLMT